VVRTDWRLVSSPLGKARETAAIISDVTGLAELEIDSRLAEISLGSRDGLTSEEIASASPDTRIETPHALFFASPDGGGVRRLHDPPRLLAGLDRAGQAPLPAPQDEIFRLSGQGCDRIDAAPAGLALGGPGR
jgi:broad specificity phosphatase PhoE